MATDNLVECFRNLPIEIRRRVITCLHISDPFSSKQSTWSFEEEKDIFKVHAYWWEEGVHHDLATIAFLINTLQPGKIHLMMLPDLIEFQQHSCLPCLLYIIPRHLRERIKIVGYPMTVYDPVEQKWVEVEEEDE